MVSWASACWSLNQTIPSSELLCCIHTICLMHGADQFTFINDRTQPIYPFFVHLLLISSVLVRLFSPCHSVAHKRQCSPSLSFFFQVLVAWRLGAVGQCQALCWVYSLQLNSFTPLAASDYKVPCDCQQPDLHSLSAHTWCVLVGAGTHLSDHRTNDAAACAVPERGNSML